MTKEIAITKILTVLFICFSVCFIAGVMLEWRRIDREAMKAIHDGQIEDARLIIKADSAKQEGRVERARARAKKREAERKK